MMNTTMKIIKYELFDVLRNKWLIGYALFFLLATDTLFRFGGGGAKVVLSFMNIMLFVIPLVCLIFSLMYIYNAREFIELLLSQPIRRSTLFRGMYFGLSAPLALGYLFGVGVPFLLHDNGAHLASLIMLLLSGVLLTFVFTALAFQIAAWQVDRAKGFGAALLAWLVFAVLYDGAILIISFTFADYPLEKPMLVLTMLNPIDLARILILLKSDFAALMGYTGAVFQHFFGSELGVVLALTVLAGWAIAPFWLGARFFRKRDF